MVSKFWYRGDGVTDSGESGVVSSNNTTAETVPEIQAEDKNEEDIPSNSTRPSSLRAERKSLVKEAEEHFSHFLNKFLMVTCIGITSSITIDSVSCGVGIGIAIGTCIVLLVTCLPIFAHAWVRIWGSYVRLSLLRDRHAILFDRVSDLKSYYITLNLPNKANPLPEVDTPANIVIGLPRSPEVVEEVDFHSRLDNLIMTISSDLGDCGCWYAVYLAGMSILGIAYCLGLPYLLYSVVCPGKKGV